MESLKLRFPVLQINGNEGIHIPRRPNQGNRDTHLTPVDISEIGIRRTPYFQIGRQEEGAFLTTRAPSPNTIPSSIVVRGRFSAPAFGLGTRVVGPSLRTYKGRSIFQIFSLKSPLFSDRGPRGLLKPEYCFPNRSFPDGTVDFLKRMYCHYVSEANRGFYLLLSHQNTT